jgi:hypothetical protein
VRGTPFLFEGFVGGLNTIDSPYTLEPIESRECLNVVSTSRGSIRKRYGSTKFTGASTPNVELTSIAPVVTAGGKFLVASGSTKLYSINTSGEVTEIGSGFTAGSRWSVVQAPKTTAESGQGPVYLSNGTDKPQYWTGAAKGTAVAVWKGVASEPKLTDGVLAEGKQIVASATAKFIASDVGKILTFETEVKEKNGTIIKTVLISEFIDSEHVVVDIGIEGWKEAYTTIHFTIERSYYEDGTSKEHVPNGKYMVFLGNRIWTAGISDDTSAVRFSEFASIGEGGEQADPSAWPKNNVVRFDASDGQPITGLGVVGPYLLVFKAHKTWVVHNLDTGENRKLSDTIGCVANRSIVETAAGTFFLTADQGVYLTNGSTLSEASYKVRPTILAINPAQRENAAGAYFNNHYYLSYASGTSSTPNRTLDYDAQLKSWWLHDLTGNQWVPWEPVAGEVFLYTIPPVAKAGVVKAFDPTVYTDSGANFAGNGTLGAFWLSSWEPFAYYVFRHRLKAPFLKKRVRQIFFNGEGQIIPSVYKNFSIGERQEPAVVANREISTGGERPVNFGAASEKWGEGSGTWGIETEGTEILWGGETSVGAARIYSPGVASVWSVGWGNNSSEGFTVHAFTMMLSFRKS